MEVWRARRKFLPEDDQIIAGGVEVVDDGLIVITRSFVEPACRSVERCAGRFYQQQTATPGLHLGFDPG